MKLELDENSVNDIVISNMLKTLSIAKNSHHVDICIRINGNDEWFQADWIKYLSMKTPPPEQGKAD